MKDSFFIWWDCLSEWIYKKVLWVTYYVLTKRKCKKIPKLSLIKKKEIQQYWKSVYGKRIPTFEYAWYEDKGVEVNPQIIPDTFWHSVIEPYFANIKMEKAFSDKNYFETIIGKKNSPETLCHCINSQLLDTAFNSIDVDELCNILVAEKEVICKPSIVSGGGRSIIFLSRDEVYPERIAELIDKYAGNFVIQKIVKQHEYFNQFNSKALNTMRILSFLYKGQVHILSGFLRIGGNNSRLDNVSSGGYYIQITKEGYLVDYAVKEDLNTHDLVKYETDSTDIKFARLQIPEWNAVIRLIEENHYKLAHFQIINWDIALNEQSIPIVIEYNLIDSSPSFHQINIGPIFGDLTDEVLQDLATKGKCNGKSR